MSDNRLEQLLPASFRGVPFSVTSEILPEEGRKIALHEYVNSDERFVEDLGRLPGKFSVRAFVHGVDWRDRMAALRAALNEAGPGELVLPVFGAVDAYALPYSVNTTHKEVGEASFDLEFALGRPSAGPDTARRDVEDVYDLGDVARGAIENVFGDIWSIPTTAANSLVAQFDFIKSLDTVADEFSTLLPTSYLAEIQSIVDIATSTAPNIIRDLTGPASQIVSIWQQTSLGISSLLSAGRSISGAFDGFMNMTLFGGGLSTSFDTMRADTGGIAATGITVPLWPETTAQRIARNNNREAIVFANRVSALVGAYEIAAAQEYGTLTEINEVREQVEAANERIMRVDTQDRDILQSDEIVRDAILNLRIAALDVLEQKRQEAFETVTITRQTPASAFVEAHRLYAEEFTSASQLQDRAIDLRRLNPDKKSTALDGDITAFRS